MDKIGVMLCGHGSRSRAASAEFAAFAERFKAMLPGHLVEYGYLEFAEPVIREGLEKLRAAGATRIKALPVMLFAAGHAKNDIPSVLNAWSRETGVRVDYGRELAVDLKMLQAAGARIEEAIRASDAEGGPVSRAETCLVVVGRGASDPDANSNVAKMARMLWEGMGFGWCETGYSGVTFPLVEPCLEHVARLGYRRVIVFPYFLFSGVLIDRIYGFTDEAAAKHPNIRFVKAPYLNDHPFVLETLIERLDEIDKGAGLMNCSLCKYRAQVLGFEHEVGAPQESHHHHVEGKGAAAPGSSVADCPLCDTFCTGLCGLVPKAAPPLAVLNAPPKTDFSKGHFHADGTFHAHDHGHDHAHGHDHHHHAPYPHADHPLGPKSVLKRLTPKKP